MYIMNTITTVDAREHLSEIINRTAYGKERIVLSRRGKELLVLIPMEDLKLIELAEDLIDLRDAKEALKEYEEGRVISLEEIEKRLSKAREI
jgi:prevent-host-death family protein